MIRRVYTDPKLSGNSFVSLLNLIDEIVPGCLGNVNHSRHFMRDFGRTMSVHLAFCVVGQHWCKVPALSLPSDFGRTIDGYSVDSESCTIVVHVITTEHGMIQWMLIDVVPNAKFTTSSADLYIHKFKRAESAAQLIRNIEYEKCVMSDLDALMRHATTCGDGA